MLHLAPLSAHQTLTMQDTLEELEFICELLVEIAALQHLRSVWLPSTSEDRHGVERFMLLEKLIAKKEQARHHALNQLQEEYPELDSLVSALSQQYN